MMSNPTESQRLGFPPRTPSGALSSTTLSMRSRMSFSPLHDIPHGVIILPSDSRSRTNRFSEHPHDGRHPLGRTYIVNRLEEESAGNVDLSSVYVESDLGDIDDDEKYPYDDHHTEKEEQREREESISDLWSRVVPYDLHTLDATPRGQVVVYTSDNGNSEPYSSASHVSLRRYPVDSHASTADTLRFDSIFHALQRAENKVEAYEQQEQSLHTQITRSRQQLLDLEKRYSDLQNSFQKVKETADRVPILNETIQALQESLDSFRRTAKLDLEELASLRLERDALFHRSQKLEIESKEQRKESLEEMKRKAEQVSSLSAEVRLMTEKIEFLERDRDIFSLERDSFTNHVKELEKTISDMIEERNSLSDLDRKYAETLGQLQRLDRSSHMTEQELIEARRQIESQAQRISDLEGELDDNRHLRDAVERERKARESMQVELLEQLDSLELSSARIRKRCEELEEEKIVLSKSNQQIISEQKGSFTILEQLRSELGIAKRSLAEERHQLAMLQARLIGVEEQNQSLREECDLLQSAQAESKSHEKVEEIIRESSDLRKRIIELETMMKNERANGSEKESQLHLLRAEKDQALALCEQHTSRLESFRTMISQLQDDLKRSYDLNAVREQTIQSQESRIISLEHELECVSDEKNRQNQQLQSKLQEHEKIETLYRELQRVHESMKNELDTHVSERKRLDDQTNRLQEKIESLESLLQRSRDERDMLSAELIQARSHASRETELSAELFSSRDLTFRMEAQIRSLEETISKKNNRVSSLESQLVDKSASLDDSNQRLKIEQESMKNLRIEMQEKESSLTRTICSLEDRLQSLDQELNAVEEDRNSLHSSKLDAEQQTWSLQREVSRLERETMDRKEKLSLMETENARLRSQVQVLHDKSIELENRIQEDQTTLHSRQLDVDIFSKKYSDCTESLRSARSQLADFEKRCSDLSREKDSLDEDIVLLRSENQRLCTEKSQLEAAVASARRDNTHLRLEKDDLHRNVVLLQHALKEAEMSESSLSQQTSRETMRNTQIEEELQAVKKQNSDVEGRLSDALNQLQDFESEIRILRESNRTLEGRAEESEKASREFGEQYASVMLEVNEKASKILELEREIETLSKNLSRAYEDLEEKNNGSAESHRLVSSLEEKVQLSRERERSLEEERIQLQLELDNKDTYFRTCEKEKAGLEENIIALNNEISGLNDLLSRSQSLVDELQDKVGVRDSDLKALQKQISVLQSSLEDLERLYSERQEQISQASEDQSLLQQSLQAKEEEIQNLQNRCMALEYDVQTKENVMQSSVVASSSFENELQVLRNDMSLRNQELESERLKFQSISIELSGLREQLQTEDCRHQELQHALEKRIETDAALLKEKEELANSLEDKVSLMLEELNATKTELDSLILEKQSLLDTIGRLRDDLSEKDAENSDRSSALDCLKQDLQACSQNCERLQIELSEARESLNGIELSYKECVHQRGLLEAEISRLELRNHDTTEQWQQEKQLRVNAENEVTILRCRRDALEDQVSQLDVNVAEICGLKDEEIESLSSRIQSLEEENRRLSDLILELQDQISHMDVENRENVGRYKMIESELAIHQSDFARLEKQRDDFLTRAVQAEEKEKQNLEEIERLKEDIVILKDELKSSGPEPLLVDTLRLEFMRNAERKLTFFVEENGSIRVRTGGGFKTLQESLAKMLDRALGGFRPSLHLASLVSSSFDGSLDASVELSPTTSTSSSSSSSPRSTLDKVLYAKVVNNFNMEVQKALAHARKNIWMTGTFSIGQDGQLNLLNFKPSK